MSTDFEEELRDLFREKASEAPLATPKMPASAPPQVLRRGRIHQLGTVLGSAALVVALIVGSVAGLTRILGEGNDRVGSDDYEVFQRTATIEAFTVGSPSDWFLVNHWPVSARTTYAAVALCPEGNPSTIVDCISPPNAPDIDPTLGLPVLQLTNADVGTESTQCGAELAADLAVLYVALDLEGDVANRYPPYLPTPDEREAPLEGDGPCGPGRYASFSVAGQPFFVWIGLGSIVSDTDRAAVLSAFETMAIDDSLSPSRPDEATPAYVVAGGLTEAGSDWRLELRPSQGNVRFSLIGSAALSDFVIPPSVIEWTATDPIFGAISKEAATVEFRGEDDPSIEIAGTIVPLPPSMPFDFDLFFIEGTAGIEGEAVALGPDGEPIEGDSSIGTPRNDVVRIDGSTLGHEWTARFRGDFGDSTACIGVTVDGEGSEPLCPRPVATSLAGDQPSLHIVNTAGLAVVVGSVPLDVAEIRFTSDSGSNMQERFPCRMGPSGWTDPDRRVCAIALPPEDGGLFEYLDANGRVLFEEGMGWSASDPTVVEPVPVDPIHGGSYWAVYPWTGSTADPAANEMVGQLFDGFGIQAWQGEIACDEGAAEALGTDDEWRVAVYFETHDEANAFASQAGLLGHEADPFIAHVTTYCLD